MCLYLPVVLWAGDFTRGEVLGCWLVCFGHCGGIAALGCVKFFAGASGGVAEAEPVVFHQEFYGIAAEVALATPEAALPFVLIWPGVKAVGATAARTGAVVLAALVTADALRTDAVFL